MIFGFLDVVSQFGVLQLNPEYFEPEIAIVFNKVYINQAMIAMEYEVVGKFLHCMKLFGPTQTAEYHQTIDITERFLIMRQLPNGSWLKMGGNIIDQYKSTVTCAKYVHTPHVKITSQLTRYCRALLTPVFQGFGPPDPDIRRLLEKWAKKMPLFSKRIQSVGNGAVLVSGVTVKSKTPPMLKKLETYYRRQILPVSGMNALESLATKRLRAIQMSEVSLQNNHITLALTALST